MPRLYWFKQTFKNCLLPMKLLNHLNLNLGKGKNMGNRVIDRNVMVSM